MKTLVKIFVIASIAITMSTLTSCSTFKSSTIKRLQTEGIKPASDLPYDMDTWLKNCETYILLEDPKVFTFEQLDSFGFFDSYTYIEAKVKNEQTGDVFDVYAYDYDLVLGDFKRMKKNSQAWLSFQKDKQNNNQVVLVSNVE